MHNNASNANISWSYTTSNVNTLMTDGNSTINIYPYYFDDDPNGTIFYTILSIYICLSLLSIIICITSIYKDFYNQLSLKKWFKLSCMVCVILWTISNILWTITYYYELQNKFATICVNLIFTSQYFIVFGYLLFAISFTLRLFYSFKDSIFELSNSEKKILIRLYIIGAFFIASSLTFRVFGAMIDIVYNYNKNTESSLYFLFVNVSIIILLISSINYFIGSIYLIRLMIIKIEQFSSMMLIESNVNKMHMDDNSIVCKELLNLIKKLIVLYTVSFISTIVTIIGVTIAISIPFIFGGYDYDENAFTKYVFRLYRLPLMIDSIINCICLIFQNTNRENEYNIFCKIGINCISKWNCLCYKHMRST